jgi:hypothetical protein
MVVAVFMVYLNTLSVAQIVGANGTLIAGKLVGNHEEVNILGVM